MRSLRYSINVTLDGCCDHRAISPDEELHRHHAKNLEQAYAWLTWFNSPEGSALWAEAFGANPVGKGAEDRMPAASKAFLAAAYHDPMDELRPSTELGGGRRRCQPPCRAGPSRRLALHPAVIRKRAANQPALAAHLANRPILGMGRYGPPDRRSRHSARKIRFQRSNPGRPTPGAARSTMMMMTNP